MGVDFVCACLPFVGPGLVVYGASIDARCSILNDRSEKSGELSGQFLENISTRTTSMRSRFAAARSWPTAGAATSSASRARCRRGICSNGTRYFYIVWLRPSAASAAGGSSVYVAWTGASRRGACGYRQDSCALWQQYRVQIEGRARPASARFE